MDQQDRPLIEPYNPEDDCRCGSSVCREFLLSRELDAITLERIPHDLRDLPGQLDILWTLLNGRSKDVSPFLNRLAQYRVERHCALAWPPNYIAYRCRTCSKTLTMALCADCFKDGDHQGHNWNMFKSRSGGACDCGYSIMNESGHCSRHGSNPVAERGHEPIPEALICVPRRAMPRLIHKLAILLRGSHVDSHELDWYLDCLMRLANSSAVLRGLMIEALIDKQAYSSQIRLLTNHPDNPELAKIVNEGLKKLKKEQKGTLPRLPDHWKSVRRDIRAFEECVEHTCFVEEFLLWTVEYEFPQKLVYFLLSFLMDDKYKQAVARSFVSYYPRIILFLTGARGELRRHPRDSFEQLSRRILQISVQLYNYQDLTNLLCEQENCLHVLVYCLRIALEGSQSSGIKCVLKPNPLHSDPTSAPPVVRFELPLIRNRQLCPLTEDLNAILDFEQQARRLVRDEDLLGNWLEILSYFQGMSPYKRELFEHVPVEAGPHISIFAIEADFCLSPLYSILSHIKDGEEALILSQSLLRSIHKALSKWLHKMDIGPISLLNPYIMTFHVPLHRMFAITLRNMLFIQRRSEQEVHSFLADNQYIFGKLYGYKSVLGTLTNVSIREFYKLLCLHPLQALVLYYEIRNNMWTRNGLMTINQAVTYVHSAYCNSTIDLDTFLLKFCASRTNPNQFIYNLMTRFHAWNWLSFTSNALMNNDLDHGRSFSHFSISSEQILQMVESSLVLLIQLLTLNLNCDISDIDQMRQELIALISVGDRSYSFLMDMLPGRTAFSSVDEKNFEFLLDQIAIYKRASHGNGGSLQQGYYVLKPEVWSQEYNPIFVQYRFYQKRDYQLSLERFYQQSKISSKLDKPIQPSALWPPLRIPRNIGNFGFFDLSPLIESPTLVGIAYSIIFKSLYINDVPEAIMAYAIHLLELSLRRAAQELDDNDKIHCNASDMDQQELLKQHQQSSSFTGRLTYTELTSRPAYFGSPGEASIKGNTIYAVFDDGQEDIRESQVDSVFPVVKHALDLAFETTWFPFNSTVANCLVHIDSVNSLLYKDFQILLHESSKSWPEAKVSRGQRDYHDNGEKSTMSHGSTGSDINSNSADKDAPRVDYTHNHGVGAHRNADRLEDHGIGNGDQENDTGNDDEDEDDDDDDDDVEADYDGISDDLAILEANYEQSLDIGIEMGSEIDSSSSEGSELRETLREIDIVRRRIAAQSTDSQPSPSSATRVAPAPSLRETQNRANQTNSSEFWSSVNALTPNWRPPNIVADTTTTNSGSSASQRLLGAFLRNMSPSDVARVYGIRSSSRFEPRNHEQRATAAPSDTGQANRPDESSHVSTNSEQRQPADHTYSAIPMEVDGESAVSFSLVTVGNNDTGSNQLAQRDDRPTAEPRPAILAAETRPMIAGSARPLALEASSGSQGEPEAAGQDGRALSELDIQARFTGFFESASLRGGSDSDGSESRLRIQANQANQQGAYVGFHTRQVARRGGYRAAAPTTTTALAVHNPTTGFSVRAAPTGVSQLQYQQQQALADQVQSELQTEEVQSRQVGQDILSSSSWLSAASKQRRIRRRRKDRMHHGESVLSLLLRLHAKYSQRAQSYCFDPARASQSVAARADSNRLGDGVHFVTIVLDLICTLDRTMSQRVAQLSRLIWLAHKSQQQTAPSGSDIANTDGPEAASAAGPSKPAVWSHRDTKSSVDGLNSRGDKGHEQTVASQRRERAKEFQRRLMADFASRQQAFIEHCQQLDKVEAINLSSQLSSPSQAGVGGAIGSTSKPQMSDSDKRQPQYECCICGLNANQASGSLTGSANNHERANPLGQVVLLQASSVLGHAHLQAGQDRPLPCSELEQARLKEETYAKHLERRIDLLAEHFAPSSWLDSINIGAEGGVHVQSCGHFLHIQCHQSYIKSLDQTDRLRSRSDSDEFLCPVCRQLANSVLPVLASTEDPNRLGLVRVEPERNQLNDQISYLLDLLRNPSPPNQRELQSSASFCAHLTKATGPQYRLVRSAASMHSLFLFLASIGRTNLEAEVVARLSSREASEIVQKRTCFKLLLHVLALNAQTLITDQWFTCAKLWSKLSARTDPQNPLSVVPVNSEVPLLLHDPSAILLQFLLVLPNASSPAEHAHFTCLVRLLFNLVVVQSLALVLTYLDPATNMSSLELSPADHLQHSDSLDAQSVELRQLLALLRHHLGALLEPSEGPLLNASVRNCWQRYGFSSVGLDSRSLLGMIESRAKLACLPFLRAAACAQHHLYSQDCPIEPGTQTAEPDWQALDAEFGALSRVLNLTKPSQTGQVKLTDTLTWPAPTKQLIASWSSELMHVHAHYPIAARSLLASRSLAWFPPALMQLPDSFDEIFMFYYRKPCSLCHQVPKDIAVCLVCGAPICFRVSCCKDRSRSRQVHSAHCGANTAVFLAVHTSSVVVIRGSRACVWGSVYLDSHDEEDNGLQRGKPLHLVKARFQLLERQWLTHSFDHTCGKRWIYLHESQ